MRRTVARAHGNRFDRRATDGQEVRGAHTWPAGRRSAEGTRPGGLARWSRRPRIPKVQEGRASSGEEGWHGRQPRRERPAGPAAGAAQGGACRVRPVGGVRHGRAGAREPRRSRRDSARAPPGGGCGRGSGPREPRAERRGYAPDAAGRRGDQWRRKQDARSDAARARRAARRRRALGLVSPVGGRNRVRERSLVADVAERDRVHAVAQPRRRRAVLEDVAEVPVAAGAADLDAAHAVRVVDPLRHRVGGDGVRERRPAGAGLELLARAEERVAAPRTDVGPRLLRPEEAPGPGGLGAVAAQDLVLLRGEPLPPLGVAEDELLGHGAPPRPGDVTRAARGARRPGSCEARPQVRLRPASASRSTGCEARSISTVVSQPTQGSVTEQPYLSFERSDGMDWLPGSMKLSTMRPTTERFPSRIWWTTSRITSGCSSGFFQEFACEQSTTMFFGIFAFSRACSASEMETVSKFGRPPPPRSTRWP